MSRYVRKLGCCSSGPALAQLDPSAIAASSAPEVPYPSGGAGGLPGKTLGQLFTLSVGAGLAVWAITRLLDKK